MTGPVGRRKQIGQLSVLLTIRTAYTIRTAHTSTSQLGGGGVMSLPGLITGVVSCLLGTYVVYTIFMYSGTHV